MKTFLVSTALAVRPSSHRHVTVADIFAFELVTITGVAQEERLHSHTQHTTEDNRLLRTLVQQHAYTRVVVSIASGGEVTS